MKRRHLARGCAGAAIGLTLACAPAAGPRDGAAPVAEPGAHHGAHQGAAPAAGTGTAAAADVQFLQHMIPHHAQALQMVALVPARTGDATIRLLAERIAVSQHDEIAQMAGWLRARGHAVPSIDTTTGGHHAGHAPSGAAPPGGQGHAHHGAGTDPHANMPGMLTPAELAQLAAARGPAFVRLFLESMIRHHEGAITMVQALFAVGGGQESQLYAIASEIESDQRMEIARMRAILAGPASTGGDGR